MKSRKKLSEESRPLIGEAAERIATIIDAAERAAAQVIDDAEEQARREIEAARSRADRIAAEHLRELADRLDPPGQADRSVPHLKPVEPSGEEGNSFAPAAQRSSLSAARLLATQMAVSGSSREEIGERLRIGFQIEDPSGILDAILGPGG
jgi:hypothetical protein